MTTDDKQFFISLFKGLEARFDAFESRLGNLENRFDKLEGRFDKLEGRFDKLEGRFDKLEGRFDKLEGRFDQFENRFDQLEQKVDENSREIRYNGLLIEAMQSDLAWVKEGDMSVMLLHEKVDCILKEIQDFPVIQEAVKNHSKRLNALEAKA